MKLFGTLLLMSLLSASFALGQRSQAPPPPPPPPGPVAEYNAANWKAFTSSEGLFSISMPGTPNDDSEPVDTAMGKVVMHRYLLVTQLGEYLASYMDFPAQVDPNTVRKVLDGGRDEVLGNGSKLLNEEDVVVDGILGRELIVEKDGLVFRERMFLVKGRLFVIVLAAKLNVAFKNGSPSSNREDRTELFETTSKHFLDSFKFIKREAVSSAELARPPIAGVLEPVILKKDLYPAGVDAKVEIDSALKVAATEKKRVLLVFGGNWCYDCHVLDQALHQGAAGVLVKNSFVLVHVDIGEGELNGDLLKKYRIPLAKGVPAVAVLRQNGDLLFSSGDGEFEAARSMKKKYLLAFLNRWKAPNK